MENIEIIIAVYFPCSAVGDEEIFAVSVRCFATGLGFYVYDCAEWEIATGGLPWCEVTIIIFGTGVFTGIAAIF